MAEKTLKREMAAVYTVSIQGFKRTEDQLARLKDAIKRLRATDYTTLTSTTIAAQLGSSDIFVTKMDDLEGRVQGATVRAMDYAMKRGKEYQTYALVNAVTPTGLSGYGKNPAGRRGPGRDDTGTMIDAIRTNVEVARLADGDQITGWHGWSIEERENYFRRQEQGTRHITPANSLGVAIVPTTEDLKRELGKMKR